MIVGDGHSMICWYVSAFSWRCVVKMFAWRNCQLQSSQGRDQTIGRAAFLAAERGWWHEIHGIRLKPRQPQATPGNPIPRGIPRHGAPKRNTFDVWRSGGVDLPVCLGTMGECTACFIQQSIAVTTVWLLLFGRLNPSPVCTLDTALRSASIWINLVEKLSPKLMISDHIQANGQLDACFRTHGDTCGWLRGLSRHLHIPIYGYMLQFDLINPMYRSMILISHGIPTHVPPVSY